MHFQILENRKWRFYWVYWLFKRDFYLFTVERELKKA